MLNTESKLAGLLIWAVIAAMVVGFAWSFLAWPTPSAVIASLLGSELAAFAQRNQTILAGLIGFGAAAFAFLLNGWRERTERRHAIQRRESRTAGVLAKEAAEIAGTCEAAARALTVRGQQPEAVGADLRSSLAAEDNVLLSAPMTNLAGLGTGAATAVRQVRAALRRLTDALDAAHREDGAGNRIASRALEASLAAGHAARVMETLAKAGVRAADRVRPTYVAANADTLAGGEAMVKPSRMQSAA